MLSVVTSPENLHRMSLTDARRGIAGAARRAHRTGEETILTERGEEPEWSGRTTTTPSGEA
jgi:hypothetical protein